MRAGELRHRVTIQQKSVTRDGFGAEVISWPTFATVWAKIETPTGREFIEQSQAGAEVSHKVTIRYRSGVIPTMRLSWSGRVFEIGAALNDNLKREMTLMCSEIV